MIKPDLTTVMDDLSGIIEYAFGRNKQRGLLSTEDSDLAELSWGRANGYSQGCQDNGYKNQMLHRVVLERVIGRKLKGGEFVDHINGIRYDNRRCNLRLSNNSLNQANRGTSKRSTTGYKGCYLDISVIRKGRSNPYRAMIRVNNKLINLGSYDTPEEAAKAYDGAAVIHFGEHAKTNF